MNDVFNQDNRNALLDEISKRASAISEEDRAQRPSFETGKKFSEWLDEAESIVEEKPVPPRITPTQPASAAGMSAALTPEISSNDRSGKSLLGTVMVSSVALTLMVGMYFGYMTFSQKWEETMAVMADLKEQVDTLKNTNEAQKDQLSEMGSIVSGFALYQEALAKGDKLVAEQDFLALREQVESQASIVNKVEPLVADVNQNLEEVAQIKTVLAEMHQQSLQQQATMDKVASLIESNTQNAQVDQARVVETLNDIQTYLNQQLALLSQVYTPDQAVKVADSAPTDTVAQEVAVKEVVNEPVEPKVTKVVKPEPKPLSWIEQRDQNRVTLQLMRLKDKQKLEEFVKNQGLEQSAHIYPSASKSSDSVDYVLIYGDFASQEEANLVSQQLKQKVRWLSPWAREFSSVLTQIEVK